jgi:polynucleotide 5'-kinase involved in rRNA processing
VTAALEDFIRESDAMKELVSPRNRLVMAVGSSDSGKTTLVECLADFFSGHAETGVVDLDMGQSHIGPPTAIAWGRIKEKFEGWDKVKMEDYYFTGTTTPAGSLLPAVVGARLMTDKALISCRKVVVDTTGLISEPAGRALKQLKIDLLCPDIVLALERSHELAHILDAFHLHKSPKIFRLPVPEEVKTKTPARRGQYRFEKMKRYFAHSHTVEISIRDTGIRFTREPLHFTHSDLRNRIVSFRDEKNIDIGLGFIEDIELKEKRLLIRTPVSHVKFVSLVIGRAEMDMANSLLVVKR